MTGLPIRVLLAGHPLFLAGLSWLLQPADDLELAAAAGPDVDLLEQADRYRVDVAVIDLDLPGDAGAASVRRLRCAARPVAVLGVATSEVNVLAAVRAGALGFVPRCAAPVQIQVAIRAVACGMAVLGSGAASGVLGRLASTPGAGPFPALTGREHQVLDLLASGTDNFGVARQLRISVKTVRNHVSNILTKLGVPDRGRAIVLAREAGLGRGASPVLASAGQPG